MKTGLPKRKAGLPNAENLLARLPSFLDRGVTAMRTLLLVSGLFAALMQHPHMADFLFTTGLVLHLTIWFEGWWMAQRTR